MTTAIEDMDRVWRIALRAALPVYRTTPISLLHHAAGQPPIQLLLDQQTRLHALRLYRLDREHPLRKRCKTANEYPKSRLARTLSLLPIKVERTDPIRHLPWFLPRKKVEVAWREALRATAHT